MSLANIYLHLITAVIDIPFYEWKDSNFQAIIAYIWHAVFQKHKNYKCVPIL